MRIREVAPFAQHQSRGTDKCGTTDQSIVRIRISVQFVEPLSFESFEAGVFRLSILLGSPHMSVWLLYVHRAFCQPPEVARRHKIRVWLALRNAVSIL